LAQPDLRSAMGNSPSFGLGGGSAHSSRDVRRTDPEKEINRPIASRAPTHNEYTELPESRNSHNGARTWGPNEVRQVPVPNSRTSANSNAVPEPVYEEVQPARVLPASREEPGSPRTRCSTKQVRPRTHQEFDRQFDQQHQQHLKQFDRELTQSFQKIDIDPKIQFD